MSEDGKQERIAGVTLDAEIASRVMGWKRGQRYGNGNGEWIIPGQTNYRTTWDQTPSFSTKIADAWRVVEKMRERRFDFAIRGVATYTADFSSRDDLTYLPDSADSDNPALAICLAALDALT